MRHLLFFFIILYSLNLKAQTEDCGFDENMNDMMDEEGMPLYMDQLEQNHQEWIDFINNSTNFSMDIEIPIIFHVVHTGQPIGIGENIPWQQVKNAFDKLNGDFLGTGIQFCLAKRQQNGEAVHEPGFPDRNGVVRVDASSVSGYYASGVFMGGSSEYEVKTLGTDFSNYSYLNVWVVHKISSANSNGEVAGFAPFAGSVTDALDGVMMDKDYFGISDYRVLTHEVGHYLRLYHTFQGDDPDGDGMNLICPTNEGDLISDTDPHIRPSNNTCPTHNNTCANNSLEVVSENHMNYTGELCREQFTLEQITRMQATILGFRPSIQNTIGCNEPCNNKVSPIYNVTQTPISADQNGQNWELGIFLYIPGSSQLYSPITWLIDGVDVIDEIEDNMDYELNYKFETYGQHTVCVRATFNECEFEYCKTITVFSPDLCDNSGIEDCQLLKNGDFSQVNGDEILSNNTIDFMRVNNGDYQFNKICNWYGANGTPTAQILDNSEISFRLYDSDISWTNKDVIATQESLNLVHGESYYLSFDYRVEEQSGGQVEGLEFGFSHDFPLERNSFNSGSDLDYTRLNPFYNTGQDYENTDYGIFTSLGFTAETITFIYDDSDGEYLYLRNIPSDLSGFILVKNISISQCPPECSPDPDISVVIDPSDPCKYTFTAINNGDPGIAYWDIESGPAGMTDEVVDFSFAMPGTYKVCLNISCAEYVNEQKCVDVQVANTCENCNITIWDPTPGNNVYNTLKCPSSEEYIVNVTLGLDPGDHLCRKDYVHFEDNSNINYYSTFLDELTYPNIPLLKLSISFSSPPSGYHYLTICDADGNSICYNFYVGPLTECDECLTLPTETAECMDPDDMDMTFVYGGSFDIDPGSGFEPCGSQSSSTVPGYIEHPYTENNGTYTFPYTIMTSNQDPFISQTTVCFADEFGYTKCFTVSIDILETCEMDEDACIYQSNFFTLTCRGVDGNTANFNFDHIFLDAPEIQEGFTLCDADGATIDGANISINESYYNGFGYITDIDLMIPCSRVSGVGEIELILNFCSGVETFCLSLDLALDCPDCPGSRPASRSSNGSEEKTSSSYQIYPNPAIDEVIITNSDSKSVQQLSIYDIYGKKILSHQISGIRNAITLNNLNSGLYIIEITNGNQVFSKKIIKQ